MAIDRLCIKLTGGNKRRFDDNNNNCFKAIKEYLENGFDFLGSIQVPFTSLSCANELMYLLDYTY